MEPVDRLAAFLAGDLRADERAELEDALARDPELRAMLAAMRRADQALSELHAPEPPAGFDERTDAVLDEVLAETLADTSAATSGSVHDDASVGDELAARRSRRTSRGLVGAAAAGLVLLAGGVAVTQFLDGASDDAADDTDVDMMLDTAESGDDAAAPEADAPPTDEPVVIADDRTLDEDDLDALLDDDALTTLAARELDAASSGEELAHRFQSLLGESSAMASRDSVDDDADDAADGDEDAPSAEPDAADEEADVPTTEDEPEASDRASNLTTRSGQLLDDDAADAVGRCLAEVLSGGAEAIPVYAELATVEGQDAVVLGLLTVDRASGTYGVREIWAMDRDTCEVLRFSQRGPGGP